MKENGDEIQPWKKSIYLLLLDHTSNHLLYFCTYTIDVSSTVVLNCLLKPVSMLHVKVIYVFNFILNVILLFSLIK